MRIIEQKITITPPKRVTCLACSSVIEYENNEIQYGAFGCGCIICPVCGQEIDLDTESEKITSDNIEYPRHFMKMQGVKCDDEEIQKWVHKCLKVLEEDPEEYGVFAECGSGNTTVFACKYADEYSIVVAKDYEVCSVARD